MQKISAVKQGKAFVIQNNVENEKTFRKILENVKNTDEGKKLMKEEKLTKEKSACRKMICSNKQNKNIKLKHRYTNRKEYMLPKPFRQTTIFSRKVPRAPFRFFSEVFKPIFNHPTQFADRKRLAVATTSVAQRIDAPPADQLHKVHRATRLLPPLTNSLTLQTLNLPSLLNLEAPSDRTRKK